MGAKRWGRRRTPRASGKRWGSLGFGPFMKGRVNGEEVENHRARSTAREVSARRRPKTGACLDAVDRKSPRRVQAIYE
eukprot:3796248-Pyramimonas_sp.AAC.1